MKYVIGAIVGLLWGALVAWLNSRINKAAIAKNDTKAMMEASLGRTVIDVAALGAVFLLRNVLPFNDGVLCLSALQTGAGEETR